MPFAAPFWDTKAIKQTIFSGNPTLKKSQFKAKKCYYIRVINERGIFYMQEDGLIEAELLKENFGRMLTRLRREYNLTQEKLSEITGISDVYLRKIERGKCAASWVIWLTLCTVLNVDISVIQKEYIVPAVKEKASELGKVYVYSSK